MEKFPLQGLNKYQVYKYALEKFRDDITEGAYELTALAESGSLNYWAERSRHERELEKMRTMCDELERICFSLYRIETSAKDVKRCPFCGNVAI